jgi:hypothetical protein
MQRKYCKIFNKKVYNAVMCSILTEAEQRNQLIVTQLLSMAEGPEKYRMTNAD